MSQEERATTKYLRDKKNIYVISVMKEKNIILTARIMSMIFTPFYLPMVGLIALFIFSYMSLLPIGYKLVMLAHGLPPDRRSSIATHPPLPHGSGLDLP